MKDEKEMLDSKLVKRESRYFLLVGSEENWKTSLETNLWGFTIRGKGSYNTSRIGDYLAFYVTHPIKRIIGFGIITKKFISKKIVWNDEKLFNKPLWIYKLELHIVHCIENWNNGIKIPSTLILGVSRKVVSKEQFSIFVRKAEIKWGMSINEKMVIKK